MTTSSRLQRALAALSRERKHAQRDLGEVSARRARLTTAIERLGEIRESVSKTKVVDPQGRLDRNMYLVSRGAEDRMTREMGTMAERLERFDREITHPVRERLRTAAVRERAMETLLERRREAQRRAVEKRERLELDELANHGWSRARRRVED